LDVFARVRDADVGGQQEPLKRKKRAKLYYLRDRAPKESTVIVNDKVAPPQPPVSVSVSVSVCVFPAPLLSPHFLLTFASLLYFRILQGFASLLCFRIPPLLPARGECAFCFFCAPCRGVSCVRRSIHRSYISLTLSIAVLASQDLNLPTVP
jgi:hypothetical protein